MRLAIYPADYGKEVSPTFGHLQRPLLHLAQGPALRRHNRLRNVWIQLCRRAGWHTDAEQLVFVGEGETKRADFVTITPDGQRLACDVMVTASPTPWTPHGEHLYRSAGAKATRYNTSAGGLTHDRARMHPLVHDAHNHWLSGEALSLFHARTKEVGVV